MTISEGQECCPAYGGLHGQRNWTVFHSAFLEQAQMESSRFYHHHAIGKSKSRKTHRWMVSAQNPPAVLNCFLERYIRCHTVEENWGGLLWRPYCVRRIHRIVTGTNHATSWVWLHRKVSFVQL